MKKNLKNIILFALGGILLISCDIDNPSRNNFDEDRMKMMEAYIKSDTTLISIDYPIYRKGSTDYVFNSKKEIIGIYNLDNDTMILLAFIFSFAIGFGVSATVFADS